MLQAQNLRYSYGSMTALDGFSIELYAGEILGLLGPNGAGKTTAIRVLTTVYPIERGQLSVMGIPHTQPEKIRSIIGVLPESNGFPKDMSGSEYLKFMGCLYEQSPTLAKENSRQLLQLFGLDEKRNSNISTYSRGMRQRLAMARALINDPKILFLDEPTLGLDPKGQLEMLEVVHKTAVEKNAAVVLCSHHLEVIESICHRVVILNRGHVVTQGSVSEVKRQFSPPMTCRIKIPEEVMNKAVSVLKLRTHIDMTLEHDHVSELKISLHGGCNESAFGEILSHLIDADIPIESFNRETTGLSYAFLRMIEETKI